MDIIVWSDITNIAPENNTRHEPMTSQLPKKIFTFNAMNNAKYAQEKSSTVFRWGNFLLHHCRLSQWNPISIGGNLRIPN
jgi:hypothetical protein